MTAERILPVLVQRAGYLAAECLEIASLQVPASYNVRSGSKGPRDSTFGAEELVPLLLKLP